MASFSLESFRAILTLEIVDQIDARRIQSAWVISTVVWKFTNPVFFLQKIFMINKKAWIIMNSRNLTDFFLDNRQFPVL